MSIRYRGFDIKVEAVEDEYWATTSVRGYDGHYYGELETGPTPEEALIDLKLLIDIIKDN